jgi:hypothetical protein
MPGGLAGRCTTIYASPPESSTEGVGVEPTEAFAPTVFGTAWHARAQPPTSGRDARTRTGIGGFGVRLFAFNVRPSATHQEGLEPPTPFKGHSFTGCCRADSAADANLLYGRMTPTKTSRKNLMKAGRHARGRRSTRTLGAGDSPPSSLKVIRLSNSKIKGAGLLASHRKQARSLQVSAKRLEIWGAGGPPPLS